MYAGLSLNIHKYSYFKGDRTAGFTNILESINYVHIAPHKSIDYEIVHCCTKNVQTLQEKASN